MDEQEARTLLAFAEEADRKLRGLDAPVWRERLQRRYQELEAAFDWLLDHGQTGEALALACALTEFLRISGRVATGRAWLDRALSAAARDDRRRAVAVYEQGLLAFWQGDDEEACTLHGRSLQLARRLGDPTTVALALCGLARVALREDLDQARALCEEALQTVQDTDDRTGRSSALHVLGVAAQMRGDLGTARDLMTRRTETARALGDYAAVASESSNLSVVERQLGNLARAEELAREALLIEEQRGDEWAIPYSLNGLAAVAVETGEFDRAAMLLGAAAALQDQQGNAWPPDEAPHFQRSRAALAAALDPERRERAWSAGQQMSSAHAVRYALAPRPGLTSRHEPDRQRGSWPAMQTANRSGHDVVVVGGRVAGSATAMLLAHLGHDVVVVEQASFPSDTISTHSIARSGVVQLRRWGLLEEVLDSGAPAIRQVTFNSAGASTSRTIKDKAGVDLLVAPRRYVLDTILTTAAEHAGAEVRYGVTVTGVQRDGRGRVVGVHGHDRSGAPVELGARYVIGADGLRSRVAGLVGAAINEVRPAVGAAQYAYYAGISWSGIEFFVAERSFAGVFPTHDGQACIWICTPSADATAVRRRTGSRLEAFGRLLQRSAPQLAERRRHARRTSPVQGMLRQPNQLRQAFGPGWALVGDASYYRDAVTAYGISDAFRDAELLAVALDQALGAAEETTALAAYQHQRDQALREIFELTCRLAAYPPVATFVELQKQLSAAIDTQAAALAARPIPCQRLLATA